jgi:hypothetical protein
MAKAGSFKKAPSRSHGGESPCCGGLGDEEWACSCSQESWMGPVLSFLGPDLWELLTRAGMQPSSRHSCLFLTTMDFQNPHFVHSLESFLTAGTQAQLFTLLPPCWLPEQLTIRPGATSPSLLPGHKSGAESRQGHCMARRPFGDC